jgi:DNA helicase HerA-like ATPase
MNDTPIKDAILRIGEVSEIKGRKVYISVDKNKNSSDLLFDGKIIKNISVGSYIEIRKGFLSIIGKVDGEKLIEDSSYIKGENNEYQKIDKNKRTLAISLSGYIGFDGKFIGGIKELPLISNEAYILTEAKIHKIHNLLKDDSSLSINIAKTDIEEVPIDFPIDGLFNSHIAIFGNTGSGKSNTLAALYQELFSVMKNKNTFRENCRFLLFDFNGEYKKNTCITSEKKVYNLSTRSNNKDKIPFSFDELFDIETLSILVEATEKTQKPFLKRTLRFYKKVKKSKNDDGNSNFENYFMNIIEKKIKDVLLMTNKDVAFKILDYIEEILGVFIEKDTSLNDEGKRKEKEELRNDIEFHNQSNAFFKKGTNSFFNTDVDDINNTNLYKTTEKININGLNSFSELEQFYIFLHLQLINDLYRYKVQNDHIYPVINRFKAKQQSIEKIFKIENNSNIWNSKNFIVINHHDVNLDMRKTIPLLIAKNIYNTHKGEDNKKSLNIIIDEAHNILSKTSFRETEEWKDYRLETFEEIIKEGRKFGVFVTIASQRPNDISDTIISQAHNYFIHQLINQKDLFTIGNAVSYIDKITEESIPTLSVGTCIFSGIATPMPLKIKIYELIDEQKPDSLTLKFEDIIEEKI